MFRTRRELEAQLLTRAAQRRSSPHRDPNWFEVIVGVSAFLVIAGLALSAIAWFGS